MHLLLRSKYSFAPQGKYSFSKMFSKQFDFQLFLLKCPQFDKVYNEWLVTHTVEKLEKSSKKLNILNISLSASLDINTCFRLFTPGLYGQR